MRRWLTLAIARHDGICANLRFDYLAQWLWRQVARAGTAHCPEARSRRR
ncbi:MAG: exodeoxyribonuclease V subunit gamma [Rubrivivax sp.]|nr:exodeoxyribonuclease V subunit gamma [Rubrivivax sp.]